jgi:hypothetical protein
MNVVMTGAGHFVEVQGTAEGAAFSAPRDGRALLALAEQGMPQPGRCCKAIATEEVAGNPYSTKGWHRIPMKIVLASNNPGKLRRAARRAGAARG